MIVLTRKQLLAFVKIRNKSGLNSNMQFQSDLAEVTNIWKIAPSVALGPPTKFKIDGMTGYQWDVPIKGEDMPIRMIEFGRLALDCRLPRQSDEARCEDIALFELVKRKAVIVPIDDEDPAKAAEITLKHCSALCGL
jgi:hypothetical protein